MGDNTTVTCTTLDHYPNFVETFIDCPSICYIIFTSIDAALTLFQIGVFIHLLYITHVENKREVPYLVSLAPICSIVSVVELFNLSTVELLSAFRYVYLVFCILQFYQYISSYYGDWEDLVRLLPGFVYEAKVCCLCCSYQKEIALTKKRLYTNKTFIYLGVIIYMVVIMITVAFNVSTAVEDVLQGFGVVLFIMGIRSMRRFISITQQFYPEISGAVRRKWVAVRICFLVVGLQGFVLKLFSAIGIIPPIDLFNEKVMVDVVHNLLVPAQLCFAVVLAHRAFHGDDPSTLETTPLLPKQQRGHSSSQTEEVRELLTDTLVRVDSGVDSPEFEAVPGYGSLSVEMMNHIEQGLEDSWRQSHPDLTQSPGDEAMWVKSGPDLYSSKLAGRRGLGRLRDDYRYSLPDGSNILYREMEQYSRADPEGSTTF